MTEVDKMLILQLVGTLATANLAAAWADGDTYYTGARAMLAVVGKGLQTAGVIDSGSAWAQDIDHTATSLAGRK